MLSFNDKTYCSQYDCIKFNKCYRACTSEIKKLARQRDLYIAYANFKHCYKKDKNKKPRKEALSTSK